MTGADHDQRTDEQLVEAARDGEVRALDRLIGRHQERVLRVLRLLGVRGQDREDVAQEVFIRVFRHLEGFRRGQPFAGWLYRVTVNACHDHRTRHGRTRRDEAPWTEGMDAADEAPGPVESVRQRELREALEAAMATLSERERAVFVLREVEALDSKDVARTLGITSITVRRHLGRARRRLRELLGEKKITETTLIVERILPRGSSHQ